jgi:hypothetical protein
MGGVLDFKFEKGVKKNVFTGCLKESFNIEAKENGYLFILPIITS